VQPVLPVRDVAASATYFRDVLRFCGEVEPGG